MRAAAVRAAARAAGGQRGAALAARGLGGMDIAALRTDRALLQSRVLVVRFASSSAAPQPKKNGDAQDLSWAVTDIAPPSPGRGYLAQSTNFDVTKRQGQMKRWGWLLKLLGFMNEDDRLFRESSAVFQSCMNQTARPEYYRALGLPRSFRAQQALLMAHVWLVHRRLTLEGDEGKLIQELVFDRLWEETVVRIRYQNVSELTVNKHLAEVQQMCFNACIAYDQGLKSGPAVFQTAVAQHLLDNETPEGLRIASAMAEYMKRELKNFERLDGKYVLKGVIPWSTLPETQVKEAPADDDDDVVLIGQRFGNWRSALDNRGKLYYWNLTTRFSVWDRPTGDKLHEGEEQA